MDPALQELLKAETEKLRESGLYKQERVIVSPQSADIRVQAGQGAPGVQEVLNFCANNYLGLSDHPALVEAAREALKVHGYGMSSVRFICGT